jgi:hypothetical protein
LKTDGSEGADFLVSADFLNTSVHIALLCCAVRDVVLMLNDVGSMAGQPLPVPRQPARRYGDRNMMRSLAELLRDDDPHEQFDKTTVAAHA